MTGRLFSPSFIIYAQLVGLLLPRAIWWNEGKGKNNFLLISLSLLRGFFTINFCLFPYTHFFFACWADQQQMNVRKISEAFYAFFARRGWKSGEYEIFPQKIRWMEFPTTPMKKFLAPTTITFPITIFMCNIFHINFFIHHHRADGEFLLLPFCLVHKTCKQFFSYFSSRSIILLIGECAMGGGRARQLMDHWAFSFLFYCELCVES